MQRGIGVAVLSVGLVALGVGAYFGLHAISKHEDALSDCLPDGSRCGEAGLANSHDANASADIATVAVTAGAVLLVGGLVLYMTAPRRSQAAWLPWPVFRGAGLAQFPTTLLH
jgi:hypothetical protein